MIGRYEAPMDTLRRQALEDRDAFMASLKAVVSKIPELKNVMEIAELMAPGDVKKLYHVIGAPTSYAELRRLVIRALRLAPPA